MKFHDPMSTLGAGVKVVVLDSGFKPEADLNPKEVKNFTHIALEFNSRHGTDMAAIIGSQDPLCLGVAPYCDLYLAKVFDMSSSMRWANYEGALDWAITLNADVVSMSFGLVHTSAGFNGRLQQLDAMGTICIAAASHADGLRGNPHVIIAGRTGRNLPADAWTVGETTRRSGNGHYRTIQGSSVSTAILAGVAACHKAMNPKINRTDFLRTMSDN